MGPLDIRGYITTHTLMRIRYRKSLRLSKRSRNVGVVIADCTENNIYKRTQLWANGLVLIPLRASEK